MFSKQQSNFDSASVMASVVGQVGCITVLLIGIALGVGMGLDRVFGTSGIFAGIFILASVPISLFLVMQVSIRSIKKMQEQTELKNKQREAEELAEETEAL